ncbi:MAG: alpha-L-fucosidase [Verrucomicrobia bacterium]|nr:alpha-L-fucosidase [Verrucomicrobiota bacterium]
MSSSNEPAPAPASPLLKETPEQHRAKMRWWNTARFGMFVHWGVYSVT